MAVGSGTELADFKDALALSSKKSKFISPVDETRFAQCASDLRLVHRGHMQKNPHAMDFLPINILRHGQCSTAPLLSLQRVSISDLCPNKTHEGMYLILRTLEIPFEEGCLNTIVEDHEGTGAMFSLCNMDVKPHEDIEDSWPPGTIFFLKEPRCVEAKDGGCYLQCGSPSDLIFVYDRPDLLELTRQIHWVSDTEDPMYTQPLPNSPQDWFELGKKFKCNGKTELAMRCCHLALHEADRMHVEDLNLLSNICSMLFLSYYSKGIYEKAITFSERVADDNVTKRFYMNAAKCYYKLKKYEVAHERFQFLQAFYPDDERLQASTQSTALRLVEMFNGDFDIYGMFQARRIQVPFPCADYIGPIRKQAIEGKGRGVVATRQLEPGTLLVVSKALAFSRNSRNANTTFWEELVTQLALLIKRNPKTFGRVIYSLFDGTNPVDDGSVRVFCSPEAEQEPILDMKKLKGISIINAIGDTSDVHVPRSTLRSPCNPPKFGCGVYDMPSYFNHSCLANASLHEFNDVVVIRAIQTIDEGEEVCIEYVSWEVPYILREGFLASHGFECSCKFCQLESKATTSDLKARQEVVVKREEIFNFITDNNVYRDEMLDNVNDMLDELYKTYRDPTDLSLKASKSALFSLRAKVYSMPSCDHPRKREKEIEDHFKTLSCLGLDSKKLIFSLVHGESLLPNDAILNENVLFACSRLVSLYYDLLKINEAKTWFRILVVFEKIYSGGDVDVLKMKYSNLSLHFDTLKD